MMKKLKEKFDRAKNAFTNKYGDHLSILDVFKQYKVHKGMDDVNDFTYKSFLKKDTLIKGDIYFKKVMGNVRRSIFVVQKININDLMQVSLEHRIITALA